MPVTDPYADQYEEFKIEWQDIPITIRHLTGRFSGMDHIEVISDACVELPITDTGYKSQFTLPERIAEYGTAVDFVLAWLDYEADTEEWELKQAKGRQLSLF